MFDKTSKTILVFNWKDIQHPDAGGAEIVTHELLTRLVQDGHTVILVTAQYNQAPMYDTINGISIIRVKGGRVLHTFSALWYYIRHLRGKADYIIEEVNTAPYLISYVSKHENMYIFYHQLAREIWFYQFSKAFAWIGYLILEPVSLLLQAAISRFKNSNIITVSESSKHDLIRFGFKSSNIHMIREGLTHEPLSDISQSDKEVTFTLLFHSSLRPMKQPQEVIAAAGIFHKRNPAVDFNVWISGGGNQSSLRELARSYGIESRCTFFGRTTDEEKRDLMKRATVLCATSIKEGWGLIVSEAHSMGTPCIVYDVDGLRDSAKQGSSVVCQPNPHDLARELDNMYHLFTSNKDAYLTQCKHALESSRELTFDNAYIDLKHILS